MTPDQSAGDLVWLLPDTVVGCEQGGRRPAVVVSSRTYLSVVDALAIVGPVTKRDRGWLNHVSIRVAGSDGTSWAMPEQVKTVSRERIVGRLGVVDPVALAEIGNRLRELLVLD